MSAEPMWLAVRTDGKIVRVSVHRTDKSEVLHVDLTADGAESIGWQIAIAAATAKGGA